MNQPEVIASENRLSKLFGFSERKVRTYFKEARVQPGMYDLEKVIQIYVENTSGDDEVAEARKVETETKKFKLSILQGEYHRADDIAILVTDMLIRFKQKMTAIPVKTSIELLNKSNRREIEEILRKNISEALEELSEYKNLRAIEVETDGTEDS